MLSFISSGADFEHMFELAPVSLWLEDYSALRKLFDQWRAEGVTDLQHHLKEQPARLRECSAALRVLKVNRRTLELFSAETQHILESNLNKVFRDDMHDAVVHELTQLWSGQLEFSNRTPESVTPIAADLESHRIHLHKGRFPVLAPDLSFNA